MRIPTVLALASFAAMLVACGGNADENAPPRFGKGTGTVTAVDAAAGTVTLDHGPIPEVKMRAMKMPFTASPAILQDVAVGDRVAFDVRFEGGKNEVTAIATQ